MTFQTTTAANFNAINRDFFANDELTQSAIKSARSKIEAAKRSNGSLDWSKLPNLLTVNPKVIKGEKYGYLTAIQHFAPSFMSGYNVCPFASGCGKVCLTFSGHGQRFMLDEKGQHSVHIARIVRTIIFFEYRDQYFLRLPKEIASHEKKAKRQGAVSVVRLNGTSDIKWEKINPEIFTSFPKTIFYDYTKIHGRDVSQISNYSLTYSMQETNLLRSMVTLKAGANVAIVFRLNARKKEAMPKTWRGFEVIDGDQHDLRFLDKTGGIIVGLRSKGAAYFDQSGFVYEPHKPY